MYGVYGFQGFGSSGTCLVAVNDTVFGTGAIMSSLGFRVWDFEFWV